MSITMTEQPTGMVLPRCSKCGKDVFCRDISSEQELTVNSSSSIEVMPLRLGNNLVGQGLRQDDFTCSACLLEANRNLIP